MAVRASVEAIQNGRAYAADVNSWAHGWVAWRTRDFGGNVPITEAAGETEITTLTVTPTLVAGRRYKITGQVRFGMAPVSPDTILSQLKLYADATLIDSHSLYILALTDDHRVNVCGLYLAAADGAVTFKMTATCFTAAHQFVLNNTAFTPGLMLVEDIGTT